MVLSLLVGQAGFAGAQSLSDPTRPSGYSAAAPLEAAPLDTPTPVLSSVMVSPGRRVAVIDGEVVREGGRIGKFQVLSIDAGRVRLRGPQGYSTIKLLPAPVKRAARKATE